MPTTAFAASPALDTDNANLNINFRIYCRLSTDSNGQLRVRFRAGNSGDLGIVGASIGKWDGLPFSSASADMAATPIRLTFSGGSGTRISNSTTGTSDFVSHPGQTFSAGDWVIVAYSIGADSSADAEWYNSTGSTTMFTAFFSDATDFSQYQTAASIAGAGGPSMLNSGGTQPGAAGGRSFSVDLIETNDPSGALVQTTMFTNTNTFYAPDVVGPPYWTLVGISEAAINASGNYVLTEPAGCQANDILVVDFAVRSTVIYTNASFTFPQSDTGGNTTNNTTASDTAFQSGYHIRGGSAPTLTFSRTGGSRALGTMRAYRSNLPGVPSFGTSAKLAMGAAGTAMTLSGGVTTTVDRELITTAVALARASATTAQASAMDGVTQVTGNSGAINTTIAPVVDTWTERSDRGNTTSPTVALALYDVIKSSAGSTGNLTATAANSALHGMVAMTFRHPPQVLLPTLHTEADTFYAATVSQGTGGQTLTPSLYTDADAFYAATVTPGAVALTAGLYTDADTFFTPTVTREAVALTPGLYTDADTFYAPTVTRGAVTLTPALFTDGDTFYAAAISVGAVTLTPGLFTDADTFYASIVTQAGGPQAILPPLYTDADTFYAATVTAGAVSLTPGLFTDPDTFYAPTVSQPGQVLTPALFTDADTFYAATVTPGTVALLPSLVIDADIFYPPVLLQASPQTLSPQLLMNLSVFYDARVGSSTYVIYRKDVRVEYFNVDPLEGTDFTSIEETYAWVGIEATKYVNMDAALAVINARLAGTGRTYDNHTMTSTPYDGVQRRYYIQATYRLTPPAIVPLNPNNLNGGGRRRRP